MSLRYGQHREFGAQLKRIASELTQMKCAIDAARLPDYTEETVVPKGDPEHPQTIRNQRNGRLNLIEIARAGAEKSLLHLAEVMRRVLYTELSGDPVVSEDEIASIYDVRSP